MMRILELFDPSECSYPGEGVRRMQGSALQITSSLLWVCLILMTMVSCMPFSPSTSSNLITFVDDGNTYNGGKWPPDVKQLIVTRISPSDSVLLSLDIATLLKQKGIEQ